MCTYSMIIDHYQEKWQWYTQPAIVPGIVSVPSPITPAEVEEFRILLQRARDYDRNHNEPHCELEEKKQKIKELARQLGVDVSFVDGQSKLTVNDRGNETGVAGNDWQREDAHRESQVTRDDR